MKIPHDKFCILPWVSLEASPVGTVRPCCLALNEICDDQGTKFSLGESNIDTIRQSSQMRDLRQAFLRGDLPTDCDRCWNEERAGRTSKRMHTLDRLKHIVGDQEWNEDPGPLMFLDLKLGNICNLKCRICGSWSSSTYAAEEIRYQSDRKNNFHYVMMQLGRWPREEQRFWQDLEQHMAGLKYLEFTGGEPFMIQEHFDLLRKLVDRGYANDIEIHYNTNGTIWPLGAEEIWCNFRHVEIAFSIDDVGERFEYQRSGADWNTVNGHIDLFREMRNRNSNISLQVCATVNVFNIMYLDQLAAWIDQQGFDFVYWNMLHDGPQFCVANLPLPAKKLSIDRLSAAEFSDRNRQEINRIIDFMQQGTRDLGRELCDSIRQVDQRRAQDIRLVAPELADSIKYEA
jgi:MoaA/NifB/PqqE/SkfB family radical SAM enzyme